MARSMLGAELNGQTTVWGWGGGGQTVKMCVACGVSGSNEGSIGSWARGHSGDTLAKNVASVYLGPKNLTGAEGRGNKLV